MEKTHDLFHRMLDSEDPRQILDGEPDEAIRQAVERLLQHHHAAEADFLRPPVESILPAAMLSGAMFSIGNLLCGRFRILKLVGEGGMGQVYEAEDTLLHTRVALKTILPGGDWDGTLSRRLLLEVQRARRITHRNVCRIHDCFHEDQTVLLSMEYIEGGSLNEWLQSAGGIAAARQREDIALQIASAIAAIHEQGIVHGDLKPGNVLVEQFAGRPARAVVVDFGLAETLDDWSQRSWRMAGTQNYLAPELLAGGAPSIASDLYAFGRILLKLLPNDSFAQRCLREDATQRPRSVTEWPRMRGDGWLKRRTLLPAIAVAGVLGVPAYMGLRKRRYRLVARQRGLLNTIAGELGSAMLPLITHCIRQSSLIGLVPWTLPQTVDLPSLFQIARQRNASIVFDGTAARNGQSVAMTLAAYSASEEQRLAKVQLFGIAGEGGLITLAAEAVRRLRLELGEAESLVQDSWDPRPNTSTSVPALVLYFDGVQQYERGNMADALRLFEESARIDPEFALAHFGACRALSALSREPEALAACERAFQHRARATRPQQVAIESQYAVLTNRLDQAADSYRRLLLLEPEQAAWQRQLANVLGIGGRTEEAVEAARAALTLDEASQMNWSALALLQAENGKPGEALETVREARARGFDHPTLWWGEAMAQALNRQSGQALDGLRKMARSGDYERQARFQASMLQVWKGDLQVAAVELTTDLHRDDADGHSRWSWERRLRLAQLLMDLERESEGRQWLQSLPPVTDTPLYVPLYRMAGVLAEELAMPETADEMRTRLERMQQRWPATATEAALAHLRGVQAMVRASGNAHEELGRGYGLVPDDVMSLSFAELLLRKDESAAAVPVLEEIDRRKPSVLQRGYPGVVVRAWCRLGQAREKLGQPAAALAHYRRVIEQWEPRTAGSRWGKLAVQSINRITSGRVL